MTAIAPATIRDLRERTGAGMMACKRALQAAEGDMEAAIDWLRKEGLAKAAKREGRLAAEGAVAVVVRDGRGAMAQVNCETDFVARNEEFQALAEQAAEAALVAEGDMAKILASQANGASLEQRLQDASAKLGEKLRVSSVMMLHAPDGGALASYVHNALVPAMGGIGVLVACEAGDAGVGAADESARKVAMHVAAMNPLALDAEAIPEDALTRERAIAEEEARKTGKPDAIVVRMVEGRMKKFRAESSLLDQPFVMDSKATVRESFVQAAGKGSRIVAFARLSVGDGLRGERETMESDVIA